MENSIIINGGRKVTGMIDVPGDKISSVHVLLASLLSNVETIINNINYCQDVVKIIEWIKSNEVAELVCKPSHLIVKPKISEISLSGISDCRASICLLSALAFKYGHTSIRKNIGGCNFSDRPIDRHLKLLSELGLGLEKSEGEIIVRKIRKRSRVNFNCSTKFGPSVGVTIHAVLVALVCKDEIILTNIALEPAVIEIIEYVQKVTRRKMVRRSRNLFIEKTDCITHKQTNIDLPFDNSIALTYIAIAMASTGKILLTGVSDFSQSIMKLLVKTGVVLKPALNGFEIEVQKITHPRKIMCLPWPGIPSDVGPVIVAGICRYPGKTILIDKVYDQRSSHVAPLNDMGYSLRTKDNKVFVDGHKPSKIDVSVIAGDIRAGAALIVGASAKEAKTTIYNADQIYRGYPNIIENLKKLNMNIEGGL